MGSTQTAILFRKCLGLNDARALGTQKMVTNPREPDAGSTEFIDCLNMTVTPDGCVEKLPPLVQVLDAGDPITNLSAGSRLLFAADGDTVELLANGSTAIKFAGKVGPIAHTLLDVRVSADKVYKSVNPTGASAEATVGQYTGPATTKVFSAMPLFKRAFTYNAKTYLVNAADSRFLQYSEDYAADLYNLGDGHIGSVLAVLQAGSIPGVVLTTHAEGVTVYAGMSPLGEGFAKTFYPCAPIDGTLYSGFISKVYGYGHVFLCEDGVYVVGADGKLTNVTVDQIDNIKVFNSTYSCASVSAGKYTAFGNAIALEYDFKVKTLLKRATFGVSGACVWKKADYYASGTKLFTPGTAIDSTADFGCSFTLPYSDLSARGRKRFEALYFTGTAYGEWSITATDQTGESWSITRSDELVNVSGFYIKTPKHFLGNHISISVECTSGAFRFEELRAEIIASNKSR